MQKCCGGFQPHSRLSGSDDLKEMWHCVNEYLLPSIADTMTFNFGAFSADGALKGFALLTVIHNIPQIIILCIYNSDQDEDEGWSNLSMFSFFLSTGHFLVTTCGNCSADESEAEGETKISLHFESHFESWITHCTSCAERLLPT